MRDTGIVEPILAVFIYCLEKQIRVFSLRPERPGRAEEILWTK